MDTSISVEAIHEAINGVEHPEIAATLPELGMIADVAVDQAEKSMTFTLCLPVLGIPEVIREFLLQSIASAVTPLGIEEILYRVQEMDDNKREAFFAQAQANWKG